MACYWRCRRSTAINTRIVATSKHGAEPVYRLLERDVFKCRERSRGCDGEPAERVTIHGMHVGQLEMIAEWVLLPGSKTALLVRSAPPQPAGLFISGS